MNYFFFQSLIGIIGIAEENNFLTNIWFGNDFPQQMASSFSRDEFSPKNNKTDLLADAEKQLSLYLTGTLINFSLPLNAQGTPFMCSVWNELRKIPYGHTASYTDIAYAIGAKKAVRAVGMANHRNPLPIVIPCHRVIGRNGKLTGYAGGLDIKKQLLDIETLSLSRQVHLL